MALSSAFAEQSTEADRLTEDQAIQFLRIVNTVQLDLKMSNRPYGTLAQVLEHRFFKDKGEGPKFASMIDGVNGSIRNYRLFLSKDGEGSRYSVWLDPKERGCRVAFFTGESGIIYKGLPLDCRTAKE